MTIRGTLALAAVFAVLASYLVLSREPARIRTQGEATAPPLLGTNEPASRVELGHGVVVIRDGASWSVPQVEDLLAALETLRPLAVVDEAPSDASAYGLGADAPRLRVLANTRVLLDLELGASNPAGTAMYVRQSGQARVLLVGSLLRWELETVRRVASTTTMP